MACELNEMEWAVLWVMSPPPLFQNFSICWVETLFNCQTQLSHSTWHGFTFQVELVGASGLKAMVKTIVDGLKCLRDWVFSVTFHFSIFWECSEKLIRIWNKNLLARQWPKSNGNPYFDREMLSNKQQNMQSFPMGLLLDWMYSIQWMM